ncbi:MAG: T9SS type A sorting domain-containing protein [Candidatus Neomarinimicrobiota bacterium]
MGNKIVKEFNSPGWSNAAILVLTISLLIAVQINAQPDPGNSPEDVGRTAQAQSYHLFNNYPNPFNPTTTIHYQLAQPGRVMLQVFDLNGKLVATLEQGHRESGYHYAVWDAGNQGSGVYFYQISAGLFRATRKCLLIK